MTIYNQDAELYDLIYGGDDAAALEFIRWLLPYLNIEKTSPILDMGSGTGNLLIPLFEDGYLIEGMEPFDVMRSYAETKAKSKDLTVPMQSGSFQSLAEEHKYDLIMAINGPLHYITPDELPQVMANLEQALVENGYLILDTINFFSLIKNYKYPEPLDFDLAGNPATAMIQHWVDLDKEKWYNRVVLVFKDMEYQKFEDIQEMNMYTKEHLRTVAGQNNLELIYFFSSYEDRPNERKYGGRLITIFQKSS